MSSRCAGDKLFLNNKVRVLVSTLCGSGSTMGQLAGRRPVQTGTVRAALLWFQIRFLSSYSVWTVEWDKGIQRQKKTRSLSALHYNLLSKLSPELSLSSELWAPSLLFISAAHWLMLRRLCSWRLIIYTNWRAALWRSTNLCHCHIFQHHHIVSIGRKGETDSCTARARGIVTFGLPSVIYRSHDAWKTMWMHLCRPGQYIYIYIYCIILWYMRQDMVTDFLYHYKWVSVVFVVEKALLQ